MAFELCRISHNDGSITALAQNAADFGMFLVTKHYNLKTRLYKIIRQAVNLADKRASDIDDLQPTRSGIGNSLPGNTVRRHDSHRPGRNLVKR
jgi:hypothetical protein